LDPSKANTTKGIETDAGKCDPKSQFVKTASPMFGFGSQSRTMFDEKQGKAVPGPGNYRVNRGAFEKRGVLMGQKLKSLSNLNVPGAGTYAPDFSPTKSQTPKFSMGLRLKPGLSQMNNPGPGTYVNNTEKLRQSAPNFGFGSSKRPSIASNNKEVTPGPGQYRVNTRIANAKQFAMPKRQEEFMFV